MSGFKKFKNDLPLIPDGLAFLFGASNDIIVKDISGNIICTFYNSAQGEILIKQYLKENNIDYLSCSFEEIKKEEVKKHLTSNLENDLKDYCLVYLNNNLTLYKNIETLIKEKSIIIDTQKTSNKKHTIVYYKTNL